MADLTQDSLLASGDFKATSCSGVLSIASGSSGTLATLPSSGGRKIRLTLLAINAASETGITITADGVTVVNALTLASNIGTGSFSIGNSQFGFGTVSHIEANTTIVISKASGATSNQIFYATEQGF